MEELYTIFKGNGGLVTTDSRAIERGAIFFALRGDNFDGNRYAAAALEAGASVAVVDDNSVCDGSEKYVVVDNVLTALQDLARIHRRALGITIIGLTGSNGKTTTKEFLKLTLGVKYKVGATIGNLNNHIGVPLTLLSFNAQVEVGIVEMGASHQGEIALLCSIACPNIGVVTNIGRAHLEGFGGADGVVSGKGELFDFLMANNGTAIYNSDDSVIANMVSGRVGLKSMPYRVDYDAIRLSIFGAYNVKNAAAAIAVAQFMGVDGVDAIDAVKNYEPANNRSQIIHTTRGNTIIVDCYNANPSSMEFALREFIASPYPNKVAILGDMKELGSFADDEHRAIVKLSGDIERRYFVGLDFQTAGAPNTFSSVEHLSNTIDIKNSTILLKGSHSIGLEKLLEHL